MRRTLARRTRLALALALALPLAACSGGTEPDAEGGLAGTYQLRTVGGGTLPFLLGQNDVERIEVVRGSIELREDGTFTDAIHYSITPAGGTAGPFGDVLMGRFIRVEELLSFQPDDGSGTYTVTITASGLSQQIGAYRLEYSK